jgi:hypothetical protein
VNIVVRQREKKIFILVYFSRPDRNFFIFPAISHRPPALRASEQARARVSRVSRNSNRRRVDVTLPFDLIGQPTPAITAAFLLSFLPIFHPIRITNETRREIVIARLKRKTKKRKNSQFRDIAQ